MSVYNLGRVVPIFKGTYDNSKTYEKLDVVYHNGSSYVANNTTTGVEPTNSEMWQPVAMAGVLSPELIAEVEQQIIEYVQSQGYVIDSDYTHTDNNFTNADKSKLDNIDMSTKQDTLVSGTNIKTINNQSILGSGNINIEGGSGTSDYTDLSNKPSINGVELTGNKTNSQLGIPTKTSDLTNDSGFITGESEPAFNSSPAKNITNGDISNWNGKQDTLVSGTNIKSINNQNILGSGNIEIEGVSDYTELTNKPSINGTTLNGNVNLATPEQLNAKQNTLVSGTNIKTINNQSLLGSGNINISGGGVEDRKKIRLLAIGNSFTCDALAYTPFLFNDICENAASVEIGILYSGGASLQNQYNYITNDTASYTYFHIISGENTAWSSTSNVKFSDVAINGNWDIITLQQKSTDSPVFSTYEPYLSNIIELLYSRLTNIKLGWILTQSSSDDSTNYPSAGIDPEGKYWSSTAMYNGIVDCVERLKKEYPFDYIIPSGTSIQYARNNTNLINIANQLTADGYHLQEGLPSLISAYSTVLSFLELLNYKYKGLLGNTIRPTDNWLSDKGIPTPNGSSIGVNDTNVLLAQKCGITAFNNKNNKWFDDGFSFGFWGAPGGSMMYDGRTHINNLQSTSTTGTADIAFVRGYYSNVQLFHKDDNIKITIPAGYTYRLVRSTYKDYECKTNSSSTERNDAVTAVSDTIITSSTYANTTFPYWGININKTGESIFNYINLYNSGFKVERQ